MKTFIFCLQVHLFITRFNPESKAALSKDHVSKQHRGSLTGSSIEVPVGAEKQMQTFEMDELWNRMQFPEV